MRWQPLAVVTATLLGVLAWRAHSVDTVNAAMDLLRLVTVPLAGAAVFVLDDSALKLVSATPMSWARRLSLRVAVGSGWATLVWLVVLMVVAAHVTMPIHAVAGVALESAALVTVGQSVAAIGLRWADTDEPGVLGCGAVVATAVGLLFLSRRVEFYGPTGPGWADAHERWAALLGVAVLTLAVAATDPAVRLSVRRR